MSKPQARVLPEGNAAEENQESQSQERTEMTLGIDKSAINYNMADNASKALDTGDCPMPDSLRQVSKKS